MLSRSRTFLCTAAEFIRLRKAAGSLITMSPALWALVLASNGHPSFSLVAIVMAGGFMMRSAGVAIDDFWDRDVDRQMERTRVRPLASGRLSPLAAFAIFAVLVVFAAALVALLNMFTIALSVVCLVVAVIYPSDQAVRARA